MKRTRSAVVQHKENALNRSGRKIVCEFVLTTQIDDGILRLCNCHISGNEDATLTHVGIELDIGNSAPYKRMILQRYKELHEVEPWSSDEIHILGAGLSYSE